MAGKEQVRRVTKSVIFPGDYGYALSGGEIYKVPAGDPMPEALRLYSEPYDGDVPHDAKVWDPEEFARLTRRRAEPPAPVMQTAEDIQREEGWTPVEFSQAALHGFPASTGHRELYDKDGYACGRLQLWNRADVRKWKATLTALRVGQ